MRFTLRKNRECPRSSWSRIERIKAGDEAAMAEFYCDYWGPLRHQAERRLWGGLLDADDVTQALFAELLNGKSFESLVQGRYRIRVWLSVKLRNMVSRMGAVLHDRRAARATPLEWERVCGETAADHRRLIAAIKPALANLQQECVGARELALFDQACLMILGEARTRGDEQLALLLEKSPGAVKTDLSRRVRKIRERLASELGPYMAEQELERMGRLVRSR